MRFCSSAMICLRPLFILSASAMSSVDSNSTVRVLRESTFGPFMGRPEGPRYHGRPEGLRNDGSLTASLKLRRSTVALANVEGLRYAIGRANVNGSAALEGGTSDTAAGRSMHHAVDDVVDAEFVRLVRFVDRLQSGIGKLPVFRDVGVEIDHRHQPLVRIVVLENPAEDRLAGVVVLRHDVEVVDLEERMENRMAGVEIDEAGAGQHAQHLCLEAVPAAAPRRKIVEDDESALLQPGAERRRLAVGQLQKPRLRHVRHRMPEQIGIVEADDVALVHVRAEIRQLVHDLHEMTLAGRVVVRPGNPLVHVVDGRAVAQAHEGEAPVVRHVRLHRFGAAPRATEAAALGLGRHGGKQRHAQQNHNAHKAHTHLCGAGVLCGSHCRSFLACRSRIAFVFSASWVSSFSICASYCAASIDGFISRSAAIWRSMASRSSTSARTSGSEVSTFAAACAGARNSAEASDPFTPSSSVACSDSSSPSCSNVLTTLAFAYSNASAIETRPLRSRSAGSSVNA